MLHAAQIEQYRMMSPRERIAEMRALIALAERAMRVLPPEEMERRLQAADRIRERSKRALLERLSELRDDTSRPASG
jgi:hypothetical protein